MIARQAKAVQTNISYSIPVLLAIHFSILSLTSLSVRLFFALCLVSGFWFLVVTVLVVAEPTSPCPARHRLSDSTHNLLPLGFGLVKCEPDEVVKERCQNDRSNAVGLYI